MSSHNYSKFKKVLCENSVSDDYSQAVKEWKHHRYDNREDNCICGVNIIHRYHIKNIHNSNIVIIGSICIKQFMKDNKELVQEVDNHIEILAKNKYNKNCEKDKKLYRKCDTCLTKFKIEKLSHHETYLECERCNPGLHKNILNNYNKAEGVLIRFCIKCGDRYRLSNMSEHDTLLECKGCNPAIHIKAFNDRMNADNKAVRRCIDCGYQYPLKDNKMNTWQVRCYKCYFKK